MLDDEKVEEFEEFSYLRVKIRDNESENIIEHLPSALDFIHSAVKSNENVLVHCYKGISRSASIVIAYIMLKFHMSYDDAFNFVKEKR